VQMFINTALEFVFRVSFSVMEIFSIVHASHKQLRNNFLSHMLLSISQNNPPEESFRKDLKIVSEEVSRNFIFRRHHQKAAKNF
jgi:hypothetical protein